MDVGRNQYGIRSSEQDVCSIQLKKKLVTNQFLTIKL
jgi:hypothetical protein